MRCSAIWPAIAGDLSASPPFVFNRCKFISDSPFSPVHLPKTGSALAKFRVTRGQSLIRDAYPSDLFAREAATDKTVWTTKVSITVPVLGEASVHEFKCCEHIFAWF